MEPFIWLIWLASFLTGHILFLHFNHVLWCVSYNIRLCQVFYKCRGLHKIMNASWQLQTYCTQISLIIVIELISIHFVKFSWNSTVFPASNFVKVLKLSDLALICLGNLHTAEIEFLPFKGIIAYQNIVICYTPYVHNSKFTDAELILARYYYYIIVFLVHQ